MHVCMCLVSRGLSPLRGQGLQGETNKNTLLKTARVVLNCVCSFPIFRMHESSNAACVLFIV